MRFSTILTMAALVVLASCGPTDPDALRVARDNSVPQNTRYAYGDLTTREDVLLNLELAYGEANFNEFMKLIDDNFVFYFSAADVSGGQTPEQWDRSAELQATNTMFHLDTASGIPNSFTSALLFTDESTWGTIKAYFYGNSQSTTSSISISLIYPPGEGAWTALQPPPPFDNETWYEKSVTYALAITTGPITFITANLNASFTVRQSDVGGEMIWRIVAWRDGI